MNDQATSALRTFWDQFGRHGAMYLTAEALAKGGIYILFVWLATVMTVDDFGILNVFIALLTLIAVAAGIGLPEGLVRFHFSDTDFRAALTLATVLPLAAGLLLLAVVTPWYRTAAAGLNVPPELLLLALGGAPLVALRQGWLGVFRARRESGHFLLLRALEPVLFASVLIALLLAGRTMTYHGATLAYVAAVGGVAAVGFSAAAWRIGLRWDTKPLNRMIVFSSPLVAHGLAMTGLSLFDHLVLQQLLGAAATGTYAFAYRFGMAMSLLVFAFGAAWGPMVLERLNTGRGETLAGLSVTAFRLLLGACVVLAWLVPAVAQWVGGDRYVDALHLIPIIVYAYLWAGLYAFAVAHLYFRNHSGRLAAASGTAFLTNVVLNYLTIPMWGATAAAATTVTSYILLSLLIWRALGSDRSALPWGRFAYQAVLAAPVIVAASLFFG